MVEEYFITFDNLKLFYRYLSTKKPSASLVFVHGLGEHSGRYEDVIRRFSGTGYSIFAFDLRGHGRSQGKRGHIMSFGEYLKDLKYFMDIVANLSDRNKIFLIGHSMGGLIVIRYSQEHSGVSGLIMSSPLLKIKVQVPRLKSAVGRAVSKVLPWLSMTNEVDPSFLSHDPSVVQAYIEDPLVHAKVSARWFTETVDSMNKSFDFAHKITIPCLFLHAGDDRLADPEGTKSLFPLVSSKDKQMKVYEGFYHELFNERGKEQVFSDIESWLRREIGS